MTTAPAARERSEEVVELARAADLREARIAWRDPWAQLLVASR